MRLKPIIMIVLAVVFGGSAILVGNSWLARQAAQQRPAAVAAAPEAVPMATLVVAASPLRYGDEVTGLKLKQIPWPASALPSGAFATVDELTRDGKRVALAPMEPNEPVLRTKLTGGGERATVSALLDDNMGAVTIQVDEVVGLAGLVLPGDRVDVFLTRKQAGEEGGGEPMIVNDRILRNVRVLAVGQTADVKLDKPSVVRAVTIEVDPNGAQKVALAGRLGTLSLMLRKAGETTALAARRLTGQELPDDAVGQEAGATVTVMRAGKQTSYAVPKSAGDALPADPTFATGNTRRAPEVKREAVAQPPQDPDVR